MKNVLKARFVLTFYPFPLSYSFYSVLATHYAVKLLYALECKAQWALCAPCNEETRIKGICIFNVLLVFNTYALISPFKLLKK